jgi:hypothetical protein
MSDVIEDAGTVPVPTHFSQTGEVLDEREYYCPACGRRYDYRRECNGTPEKPHQATEVVSTAELQDQPVRDVAGNILSHNHTPALASE